MSTATAAPPVGSDRPAPAGRRRWAAAGAVFGLISVLTAVLFTVAPVEQRTAEYSWDLRGGIPPTPLALTTYRPVSIDAAVGCAQSAALPGGNGALLSTAADPAGSGPAPDALWIGVEGGRITVLSAGRTLWSAPLEQQFCDVDVRIDASGYRVASRGSVLAAGTDDVRPTVEGFYSAVPPNGPTTGLSASVTADTRFESSASIGKVLLGAISVVTAIGSLAAVVAVDRWSGRARTVRRRRLPAPHPADIPVVVGLVAWTLIGPTTVDDGYTTTMVVDAARTGFVGGYHHWLNSPEAPFGSFYEPLRLWVEQGTPLLWMRLPSLVLGLLSWFLLSRRVLPRLIPAARRVRWIPWLAALAFLAGWLPFNGGLRSEPYVAAGFIAVWCLIDRGTATRRLAPVAAAVLIAGLTVTVAPTGLVAAVVVLVALPTFARALPLRSSQALVFGGAVLGSGALVLVVMFADQTLGAVRAGTAVRSAIGPNYPWQDEWRRYQSLLASPDVEGSMGRRLAVLLMVVAVVVLAVVLVRRRTVSGAHRELTLRILAATGAGLVVLAIAPTKWTHHFGCFAGNVVMLTVLLAWAGHRTVRSVSHRAVLLGAVGLAASLSLSGAVTWWLSSSEGVSWWDIPPQLAGVRFADVALIFALGWFAVSVVAGSRRAPSWLPRLVPPTALVLAVVLAGTLSMQAYGIMHAIRTTPGFSQPRSTAAALAGQDCGLGPSLQIEPNPAIGGLTIVPNQGGPTEVEGGMRSPADRADHASQYGLPANRFWTVDDGRAGRLETGWYELPEEARTSTKPVVVEVGGSGSGRAEVEFGRRTPDGVEVVATTELTAEATVEARHLSASRIAPEADTVRVVARQNTGPATDWLSVSSPRVPQTVALSAVLPTSAPAVVDWPIAPLLPCQRLASLAAGVAEVPAFAVTEGRDLPEAMSRGAGGPFAAITDTYRLEPVPAYIDGEPDTWRVKVLRIVPREGDGSPTRTDGLVRAGGWSGRPPLR